MRTSGTGHAPTEAAGSARSGAMTSSSVAPEYERFVAAARTAGRYPEVSRLAEGAVSQELHLAPEIASRLMRVAALRAAGLYRPTKRTEILWVEGGRELAIGVAALEVETAEGLLAIRLPVRCDQLDGQREGPDVIVVFAVGTHDRPAGLYAATHRRPLGPAFVVDAWADQLVAYAWQCILGLVSGLAGAVGKDERGNLLIPVELAANVDGLFVTPMGRHRFYGSSGLAPEPRR